MNQVSLFTIFFKDGSHFEGGTSYFQTNWKEIPNKEISHIFYRLIDNNFLCLKGYEKYYHMVEATHDLTGKEKGKTKLAYAYIMGEKKNIITSYRITLIKSKDFGSIKCKIFKKQDKKIQGLNPAGWKG